MKVQCNQTHDDKHLVNEAMMSVFVCKQQKEHKNLPQHLQNNVSHLSKKNENIYNNVS